MLIHCFQLFTLPLSTTGQHVMSILLFNSLKVDGLPNGIIGNLTFLGLSVSFSPTASVGPSIKWKFDHPLAGSSSIDLMASLIHSFTNLKNYYIIFLKVIGQFLVELNG